MINRETTIRLVGKRGNTHKSSCMQKQEDELPFNAAVLTLDRSALRLCVSPGHFTGCFDTRLQRKRLGRYVGKVAEVIGGAIGAVVTTRRNWKAVTITAHKISDKAVQSLQKIADELGVGIHGHHIVMKGHWKD